MIYTKSIEARIKEKKVIGSGARRIAYDLRDGYVLKIAKSKDGIKSNKREIITYQLLPDPIKEHLAKIKDYETGYQWVIMKKYSQEFPKTNNQLQKLYELRNSFKQNGILPYEILSRQLKPNYQNIRLKPNGNIVVIDYGNFRFRRFSQLNSETTDRLLQLIEEWRHRPLQQVYALLFVDKIHFKVKEKMDIVNNTAYILTGIDLKGSQDVLGIWIEEKESTKFWKKVLKKLKKRGVQDIFIACANNLSKSSSAMADRYPQTDIQRSIIHQIQRSLQNVSYPDLKSVKAKLKPIYETGSERTARLKLDQFEEAWGNKYPFITESWRKHWDELAAFFKYPPELRKLMYSSEMAVSRHRRFHKLTQEDTIYSSDEELLQRLYLFTIDEWIGPLQNWGQILPKLSAYFRERVRLNKKDIAF